MKCLRCKRETPDVVDFRPGMPLCGVCRKDVRQLVKKDRRNTEAASYLEALTHPELRGLKGVRK